jgi:CRISP-associated protein Cas1
MCSSSHIQHYERENAMSLAIEQSGGEQQPIHTSAAPPKVERDTPELIPARMLNEFAYCPRLSYLEWVQGEFADNIETLEGRFGHRRVDNAPGQELPDAEALAKNAIDDAENRPGNGPTAEAGSQEGSSASQPDYQTRSVMLSAPNEGLIAKIDVLDLRSGEAIPIDYKRGKIPDVPGNAWEPEKVQLCAQGLILRENGYHCEGGVLYYIESRHRISVAFDDALVDRTRELISEMRGMAGSGVLPPPLADSPKCPRCSLVGICLPDETCLLADRETMKPADAAVGPAEHEKEVRRLLPARDDALPLYIQEQGVSLGKSGDVLTVSRKGEAFRKVKLIDVSQVSVFGSVQITAQALREIINAGIPVCHFSYGGWFFAMTRGMCHKNVELRIAQYAAAADPKRSVSIAKQLVVGKIKNCRTLLRRHLTDQKDEVLRQLAICRKRAENAQSIASLLGLEGMAAKVYFDGFAKLFKGDSVFDISGRNRRPPRDPGNALLSFVYALLVKELTVALYAVGFDPLLGFYHQPRYGRPSLALDLAEGFRPLVGDSTVLTLINNAEIAPSHFLRRAGAIALTDAGRRTVISAFERRLDTLVTHPIFRYRVSYRRILEVQARLLARHLLGEVSEYPNFCTR